MKLQGATETKIVTKEETPEAQIQKEVQRHVMNHAEKTDNLFSQEYYFLTKTNKKHC